MIVVGTAGHIDHGKSSIIRRLTGTDPDRLPEEQERGMTIDLGFAFYDAPSGVSVGFVDVPGHERFVKNMIAGAGGIDAVMLVVAADDGWMPQTEEHFQVVRLLGVKNGIIVINKCDLVQQDWLDLLDAETEEKVHGTFLENAARVHVSASTGNGFDILQTKLNELVNSLSARRNIGKPRLAIDRSFVRPGIGGVVTGTLRGGKLTVGQSVSIWPSDVKGKIRSLHCNNRDTEVALPGQRTAVGFSGIDKESLERGGVVSDRTDLSHFKDNPVLALSIELLANSPLELADRREVLVIAGTTEMTGEIRVLGGERIVPGAEGIIFFRPDEPMMTYIGDHVIVRLPTPMITLGGGRVLDHLSFLPRRREEKRFDYLRRRVGLNVNDLVTTELQHKLFVGHSDLLDMADSAREDIDTTVSQLQKAGRIGKVGSYVFDEETAANVGDAFLKRLNDWLGKQPHVRSVSMEQAAKIARLDDKLLPAMIDLLVSRDKLVRTSDGIDLPDRGISLSGDVKKAHDDILARLKAEPFAPTMLADFASKGRNYREAIGYLVDTATCYKVGSGFLLLSDTWREIEQFIRSRLEAGSTLAVGELRDKFGMTRKYIVPILEETDRVGITRRDGDVRVKGEKF